jgi:hypothetical protein
MSLMSRGLSRPMRLQVVVVTSQSRFTRLHNVILDSDSAVHIFNLKSTESSLKTGASQRILGNEVSFDVLLHHQHLCLHFVVDHRLVEDVVCF